MTVQILIGIFCHPWLDVYYSFDKNDVKYVKIIMKCLKKSAKALLEVSFFVILPG